MTHLHRVLRRHLEHVRHRVVPVLPLVSGYVLDLQRGDAELGVVEATVEGAEEERVLHALEETLGGQHGAELGMIRSHRIRDDRLHPVTPLHPGCATVDDLRRDLLLVDGQRRTPVRVTEDRRRLGRTDARLPQLQPLRRVRLSGQNAVAHWMRTWGCTRASAVGASAFPHRR